jgi:hypothetical protein
VCENSQNDSCSSMAERACASATAGMNAPPNAPTATEPPSTATRIASDVGSGVREIDTRATSVVDSYGHVRYLVSSATLMLSSLPFRRVTMAGGTICT